MRQRQVFLRMGKCSDLCDFEGVVPSWLREAITSCVHMYTVSLHRPLLTRPVPRQVRQHLRHAPRDVVLPRLRHQARSQLERWQGRKGPQGEEEVGRTQSVWSRRIPWELYHFRMYSAVQYPRLLRVSYSSVRPLNIVCWTSQHGAGRSLLSVALPSSAPRTQSSITYAIHTRKKSLLCGRNCGMTHTPS